MHCVDFSKCKVVYYSFILLKISAFQRLLTSIPSLDRRIKKIETICHCKIKIDCVDRNKCNKVLDAYHLVEVYYNETNGNHSGCVYMFKELLKDYGNAQTIITINKSKDGRIFRRNYMTENASYQIIQNGKLPYENKMFQTNLVDNGITHFTGIKHSETSKISNDFSMELSRHTTVEMIEQNVSNSQKSVEEEMVFSQMNDDQLLHHYALNKSIHSDLKLSNLLIKSGGPEPIDNKEGKNNIETKLSKEISNSKMAKISDQIDNLIVLNFNEIQHEPQMINKEDQIQPEVIKKSNQSQTGENIRKSNGIKNQINNKYPELINAISNDSQMNPILQSVQSSEINFDIKVISNGKKSEEYFDENYSKSENQVLTLGQIVLKDSGEIHINDNLKDSDVSINESLSEIKQSIKLSTEMRFDEFGRESKVKSKMAVRKKVQQIDKENNIKNQHDKNRSIPRFSFEKMANIQEISSDDSFDRTLNISEIDFDDEFISAISNSSSIFQSSSTSYDDALSQSTSNYVGDIKIKCLNFSNLLDKLETEITSDTNTIDDFIDEIASVYFREQSKSMKYILLDHLNAIKFAVTQIIISFSNDETLEVINHVSKQTIDEELRLWDDLINWYVKIINSNLWKLIRKVSEESISQSNTENLRLGALFDEVLDSKISNSVYEVESLHSNSFDSFNININLFDSNHQSKDSYNQRNKSNFLLGGKKQKSYLKYIKQQRNSSNYFTPKIFVENLKTRRSYETFNYENAYNHRKENNNTHYFKKYFNLIYQKSFYRIHNCKSNNNFSKSISNRNSSNSLLTKRFNSIPLFYEVMTEILSNLIENQIKRTSIPIILSEWENDITFKPFFSDSTRFSDLLETILKENDSNNSISLKSFSSQDTNLDHYYGEIFSEVIEQEIRLNVINLLFMKSFIEIFVDEFLNETIIKTVSSIDLLKLLFHYSIDISISKFCKTISFNKTSLNTICIGKEKLTDKFSLENCENFPNQIKSIKAAINIDKMNFNIALQFERRIMLEAIFKKTKLYKSINKTNVKQKENLSKLSFIYWIIVDESYRFYPNVFHEIIDNLIKEIVIYVINGNSIFYQIKNYDKTKWKNILDGILYILFYDNLLIINSKTKTNLNKNFHDFICNKILKQTEIDDEVKYFGVVNPTKRSEIVKINKGNMIFKNKKDLQIYQDVIINKKISEGINSVSESDTYFSTKEFTFREFELKLIQSTKPMSDNCLNQSNSEIILRKTIKSINKIDNFLNNKSNICLESQQSAYDDVYLNLNQLKQRKLFKNKNYSMKINGNKIFKISSDKKRKSKTKAFSLIKMNYLLSKRYIGLDNLEYINYKKRKFLMKKYFINFYVNIKNRNLFLKSFEISSNKKCNLMRNLQPICYINFEMNLPIDKIETKIILNQSLILPTNLYNIINKFIEKLSNKYHEKSDFFFNDYVNIYQPFSFGNFPKLQSPNDPYNFYVLFQKLMITKINETFTNDSEMKNENIINLNQNSTNELINSNLSKCQFKNKIIQFVAVRNYSVHSVEVTKYHRFTIPDKRNIISKFVGDSLINCGKLSTIIFDDVQILIKNKITMNINLDMSQVFYKSLNFHISNIKIPNLLKLNFYYLKNYFSNWFYEQIKSNIKIISLMLCLTMDIENFIKEIYFQFYNCIIIDTFKIQQNIDQISSMSDYFTVNNDDNQIQ